MKKKTTETEKDFVWWHWFFYVPYYLIIIKKGWKWILWIFIILAIGFLIRIPIYMRPHKVIEYYTSEDGQPTTQILSEKVWCRDGSRLAYSYNKYTHSIKHRYTQIMMNFDMLRGCWEYTLYYENWQIREYGHYLGETASGEWVYWDIISYYKNWQIESEEHYTLEQLDFANMQLVHVVGDVDSITEYYENGQIKYAMKENGEGDAETVRYKENGEIEKKAKYNLRKDSSFITIEYYENWILTFSDTKIKIDLLSNTRLVSETKYDNNWNKISTVYYAENWDIERVEEYDENWEVVLEYN